MTTQIKRNSSIKVASLKIASMFGMPDSIDKNVSMITKIISRAASDGVKFIVMPETAITGYASQDMSTIWQVPGYPGNPLFKGLDPTTFALEIDESGKSLPPALMTFEQQAKVTGMYIIATFLEKKYQQNQQLRKKYGNYVFYSSSMLFDPIEGMVAHYRKMNPWMPVDKSFMTAGNELKFYDTEYGRISFCVCFDITTCLPLIKKHNVWAHFHSFAWVDSVKGMPTLSKQLAKQAADEGKTDSTNQWSGNWFKAGLPGAIFQNGGGFYVVAANWSVDKSQDWTGFGYESIYSPEGIILSQDTSQFGNNYTIADIDLPAENPPPPYPLYP